MLIKGIDHLTVNVKNIQATLDFYRNVFDLELLGSIDMGDHKLTTIGRKGVFKIEFIEYKFQTGNANPNVTDGGIYRHAAFEVINLDEIKKRCENLSVKVKMYPAYIEKLNCRAMLIEDPNGVEIELVERD